MSPLRRLLNRVAYLLRRRRDGPLYGCLIVDEDGARVVRFATNAMVEEPSFSLPRIRR